MPNPYDPYAPSLLPPSSSVDQNGNVYGSGPTTAGGVGVNFTGNDTNTQTSYGYDPNQPMGPGNMPGGSASNPYAPADPMFDYAGYSGGAADYRRRFEQQQTAALGRGPEQMNFGQANADRAAGYGYLGASDATNAQQNQLAGYLNNVATGKGQTAADASFQQGLDRSIAAGQSAAAGAAGGSGYALAQRNAMANAGMTQGVGASQLGQQKFAESQAAQNQLAQLYASQRQADIGQAGATQGFMGQSAGQTTSQATLDQQQQQINNALASQYLQGELGVNTEQLQSGEGARGQANQVGTALNPYTTVSPGQMIGGGMSAVGTVMGSDIQFKSNVEQAGAGPREAPGQSQPAPYGQPQNPYAQTQSYGGPVNMFAAPQAQSQPARPMAGAGPQARSFGAPATGYAPQARAPAPAAMSTQAQSTPAVAQPPSSPYGAATRQIPLMSDARAKEDAHEAGVRRGRLEGLQVAHAGMFPTPQASPTPPPQPRPPAMMGNAPGLSPQGEALLAASRPGPGAPPPAAARPQGMPLSDERAKEDLRSDPSRMLEHLTPYSYNYKPESGEDPSRRRYGVMAQDLEKSPMGASIVEHDPYGMRHIDARQGFGVTLAALADMHHRLKRVERDDDDEGG